MYNKQTNKQGTNKLLNIVCGSKEDGITKWWRKNKEQLHNFNSSGSTFLWNNGTYLTKLHSITSEKPTLLIVFSLNDLFKFVHFWSSL